VEVGERVEGKWRKRVVDGEGNKEERD